MSEQEPSAETVMPGRPQRSRKKRALIAVGIAFAVLVAGTVGFGAYAYSHLSSNIATIEDTQDQADRPEGIRASAAAAKAPLNVLLIGSDSRSGDNGFVGGAADSGRSDTTMLLHVSADRSSALAVSIPRDSMVDMPSCKTLNGATSNAGLRQFNEAYTIGGASCVRRTVEQLTDIRIDHFVVVDFSGFRDMVNAVNGVEVYLPEAVNDSEHGITLPAGCNTLNGKQALDYVRVRHIGNGSDPERLARQQAFLSSVMQKVTSKGTLTNPAKLYSFLNAATKAMSTDKGLNTVGKLAGLATDMREVGLDQIRFMTIPVEAYAPDPNRLQWAPSAEVVWEAIRTDKPLPGTKPKPVAGPVSPSASPSPTREPLVTAPASVLVRVLNATGTPGAAKTAAAELTALGYQVVGYDTAPTVRSTTLVRWSVPRDESARTLAAATGASTRQVEGLGQVVELIVGTDYSGATEVTVQGPRATPSPKPSFSLRAADAPICS
ncbi:MAG TPA: LCP family protein [Candidatus Limnocylindria bacterium]|nr:LCP family protein [Candidatus Limnocylindria bacterium]